MGREAGFSAALLTKGVSSSVEMTDLRGWGRRFGLGSPVVLVFGEGDYEERRN